MKTLLKRAVVFIIIMVALAGIGNAALAARHNKLIKSTRIPASTISSPTTDSTTDSPETSATPESTSSEPSSTTDQVVIPQSINIKDYGATGNGTSNDSTAFKNAYNAAQSQNLPLYLPAGTYNLNNLTIWSNTTSVTIFGDGAEKTFLKNCGEIHFNYNITLSDFSIIESAAYVIYLVPKTEVTVNIKNVKFIGVDNAVESAFFYCSNNDYSIKSVTIDNCYVTNANRAIALYTNVQNCTITNCTFENLGYATADFASGIILGVDGLKTASNVLISGNTIKNLKTYPSADSDDEDLISRAYGILVYGEKNIVISYNHIENIVGGSAHTGIYTKSAEAQILYNEIINCGDGSGASGAAIINKKDATTNYVIRGNKITINTTPAGTQNFECIYFKGTNVLIEDNIINMTVDGIAIEISNSYGIDSAVIRNNSITTNGYYSIYLNKAYGNISISNNTIKQNSLWSFSGCAALILCNTADTAVISLSSNTITTTNAKILNSWSCSSSTSLSLYKNTFNGVTNGVGTGLLSFSNMNVTYLTAAA